MRVAMSGFSARRARALPHAEPNVIPFIDVLLVLLIIFMVTAPTPTVDLHVDLPRAPITYNPDHMHPTVIAIRDAGGRYDIYVDDEGVNAETLGSVTLAHARQNNPDLAFADLFAEARVFVRADQSIAYGNVVEVMNRLREAHFAKVGIYAETAEEG